MAKSVQSLIFFPFHLNNSESESTTRTSISSWFQCLGKSSDIFPDTAVDQLYFMIQHWPLFFHGVNLHRVWASFSGNNCGFFQIWKIIKKEINEELFVIYRQYSFSMAEQPFLNKGEEVSYGPLSPPSTWSPRNTGITFTSCNFWTKWWSLCKPRILRPGFVPVSPSTQIKSCGAAGDGGAERHIQRAVLSLGTWRGSQSQRFVLQSETWGWVGLLEMVGTCPVLWRGLYYHRCARSRLDYPNHPKPILLGFLYYKAHLEGDLPRRTSGNLTVA